MKASVAFPTPLSLLWLILVCFPLAAVLTILATSSTTSNHGDKTVTPLVTTASAAFARNDEDDELLRQASRVYPNLLTTASAGTAYGTVVKDDDDDKQLFLQASRVNPNPSLPAKLAFMFLTTTPLPFAPLWELFFNQTSSNLYNVYIHADPTSQYDPPFSGVFANRVISGSKPTRRHTPTITSATRRLLSHALLHDPSNSMFALLSPSCIPLHSFNFTYTTLTVSKKSFIEILKNESNPHYRWATRGGHALLPEVRYENFRTGSQFFVLTREHARLVVSDRNLWPKFKLPCLRKYILYCYPEEQYFPTLISVKDPRGCIPATLTHVDWSVKRNGHPRMYTASEVGPGLISAIRSKRPSYGDNVTKGSSSYVTKRNDPFLFARKFSPDSIQPLLRIASEVIFKD
ncbi:hypothetical protein NMG60_11028036 [Bertholletia excelsa]